jgi:hypothetical protein
MPMAATPPSLAQNHRGKGAHVDAAVWGLIGTLVGAAASIATSWLAVRSSAKLQQEKAREERTERARAFQRETLLELQHAILDACRHVGSVHLEDMKAYAATKQWGNNMLADTLSEADLAARRRVLVLAERIVEDDLRTKVKSLMLTASNVLLAKNPEESKGRLQKVSDQLPLVMEPVGAALRRFL